MAVGIVDLLETIDVDQHQRELLLGSAVRQPRPLDRLDQVGAARQRGQAVGAAHAVQMLFVQQRTHQRLQRPESQSQDEAGGGGEHPGEAAEHRFDRLQEVLLPDHRVEPKTGHALLGRAHRDRGTAGQTGEPIRKGGLRLRVALACRPHGERLAETDGINRKGAHVRVQKALDRGIVDRDHVVADPSIGRIVDRRAVEEHQPARIDRRRQHSDSGLTFGQARADGGHR
ncbi:MAG: hypothetical protein ACOC3D_03885 [Pseudomonadota bacterium]